MLLSGAREGDQRAVARLVSLVEDGDDSLPEIAAAELGSYLVRTPAGEMRIKAIIRDDIAEACARGDRGRELALKLLLREFVLRHPCCDERHKGRTS